MFSVHLNKEIDLILTATHMVTLFFYSENRNSVKPFFPYMRILLAGLRKLPPLRVFAHRGVTRDLSASYIVGKEVKHVRVFYGWNILSEIKEKKINQRKNM